MEDNPDAKNLVKELKTWARKRKVTEYRLAKMLGVDRERVNKWFAGKLLPSLQHGLEIQKFLKENQLS